MASNSQAAARATAQLAVDCRPATSARVTEPRVRVTRSGPHMGMPGRDKASNSKRNPHAPTNARSALAWLLCSSTARSPAMVWVLSVDVSKSRVPSVPRHTRVVPLSYRPVARVKQDDFQ
eukprot:365892-Chlamydomonas_euryale.AAC.5